MTKKLLNYLGFSVLVGGKLSFIDGLPAFKWVEQLNNKKSCSATIAPIWEGIISYLGKEVDELQANNENTVNLLFKEVIRAVKNKKSGSKKKLNEEV
jgi:hypothetical protein